MSLLMSLFNERIINYLFHLKTDQRRIKKKLLCIKMYSQKLVFLKIFKDESHMTEQL